MAKRTTTPAAKATKPDATPPQAGDQSASATATAEDKAAATAKASKAGKAKEPEMAGQEGQVVRVTAMQSRPRRRAGRSFQPRPNGTELDLGTVTAEEFKAIVRDPMLSIDMIAPDDAD